MKPMKNKLNILIIFMGVVFLSAALYRIFNYEIAVTEFTNLKLPLFLIPMTILLEIVIGILFIVRKYIKYAVLVASFFLVSAIFIGIISNFTNIAERVHELFVFNAEPTDIVLHILYVGILIAIYLFYPSEKK